MALQNRFVTLLKNVNINTLKSKLDNKVKTISRLNTIRSKFTGRGKNGKSLSLTRKKIMLNDRRTKSLSNKYLKSELLENDCAICLERLMTKNDTTFSLTCGHKFHNNCIDNWFTEQCNTICPLCRQIDKEYKIVDRRNCKKDNSDEDNSDEDDDDQTDYHQENLRAMFAIFGCLILLCVVSISTGIIISI